MPRENSEPKAIAAPVGIHQAEGKTDEKGQVPRERPASKEIAAPAGTHQAEGKTDEKGQVLWENSEPKAKSGLCDSL